MKTSTTLLLALALTSMSLGGCKKPSEIKGKNFMEAQKRQMDQARDVGKTMQKAVDDEGKRADEDSK